MSITTTTTTATVSVLADYEVHHSEEQPTSVAPEPVTSGVSDQPANWPTDHRRMPAYRPINPNLSYLERPAGTDGAEYAFIQVMLHGVWLNAAVSRLWRFTGGRINDKVFHYEVGGEW
ncbi:hypothetical protein N7478_009336 [Penicillium angulare]|uniref:uncharacterized protein n=1 Tax=Penicillium angulare TaxID=116970 RepID=UPI0025401B64|nr:uncharacterized protein N7478_009336 [Penicillium angulare]KAJ5266528.1 hypothetical protein N7478_009336 [Penicillium angulare]